jgi:catechol 2,3-dioxygenase-like lactoylglutathione lyase family enzyme
MFEKISHIGIAVKDLKASTALFEALFGKRPDHVEDLPEHKVRDRKSVV